MSDYKDKALTTLSRLINEVSNDETVAIAIVCVKRGGVTESRSHIAPDGGPIVLIGGMELLKMDIAGHLQRGPKEKK